MNSQHSYIIVIILVITKLSSQLDNETKAILTATKGDCQRSINGTWNSWSNWSSCSVSCAGGIRSKYRICYAVFPSQKAIEVDRTEENCNMHKCPVFPMAYYTGYLQCYFYPRKNGGWGNWNHGANCINNSGGLIVQKRSCDSPKPEYCGTFCGENDFRIRYCPVNGRYTDWIYGPCSTTCGVGNIVSTRTCTNPAPAYGGKTCTGIKVQNSICNRWVPCPVNGRYTDWISGPCSTTCDVGNMVSTRTCTNPAPAYGGKTCTGDTIKNSNCFKGPCLGCPNVPIPPNGAVLQVLLNDMKSVSLAYVSCTYPYYPTQQTYFCNTASFINVECKNLTPPSDYGLVPIQFRGNCHEDRVKNALQSGITTRATGFGIYRYNCGMKYSN